MDHCIVSAATLKTSNGSIYTPSWLDSARDIVQECNAPGRVCIYIVFVRATISDHKSNIAHMFFFFFKSMKGHFNAGIWYFVDARITNTAQPSDKSKPKGGFLIIAFAIFASNRLVSFFPLSRRCCLGAAWELHLRKQVFATHSTTKNVQCSSAFV